MTVKFTVNPKKDPRDQSAAPQVLCQRQERWADGKIVEPGDFGTFRISVSSEGASLAEEVTVRSITDTRVIFTPGKRFKQMLDTIEFQKESSNQAPAGV